jgi:hypothetical protein
MPDDETPDETSETIADQQTALEHAVQNQEDEGSAAAGA